MGERSFDSLIQLGPPTPIYLRNQPFWDGSPIPLQRNVLSERPWKGPSVVDGYGTIGLVSANEKFLANTIPPGHLMIPFSRKQSTIASAHWSIDCLEASTTTSGLTGASYSAVTPGN